MRAFLLAALLVLPASAQEEVVCKLEISYSAAEPEKLSFKVPDKRCDVKSIKRALSYLLYRFEN